MKITKAKIKKELAKNYNWRTSVFESESCMIDYLISDVLKIVDKILKEQKGITIK